MEVLLIALLGVVVFKLWNRVDALERLLAASAQAGSVETPQSPKFRRADPVVEQEEPVPDPVPMLPPDVDPEPASDDEPHPELGVDAKPVRLRLPRFDFEDLFGRLLPIWAGGITLAVAGYFIVSYSIEAGLLTPPVRVILGLVFGIALIGGAEAAFRFEDRVSDPRVRQALAGAGIATLYACFYLAGNLYQLIPPLAAFIGLAAVTAGATALSYRFGVPCAVLGLIGGFAAPLLAGGTDANVPLLTIYLALVTAGLMVSARQRKWAWLGLAALGGGLGWGVLLLASGTASAMDILAIGVLVIVVGALLPAIALPQLGTKRWLVESISAGLAALQMALLVEQAEYTLLSWGMFGLLSAALAVLGWRNPGLRRASGFAAVLVPLLLLGWDDPAQGEFVLVAAAFALLLAGVPVALAWRGQDGPIDRAQAAVAALGLMGAVAWHSGSDDLTALAGLALSAFPALAAWRLWPGREDDAKWSVLGLCAAAMVLLLASGMFAADSWAWPLVAAAVAGGWLALTRQHGGLRLRGLGWGAVAVTALFVLIGAEPVGLERLGGVPHGGADLRAALTWAALAALLAWLARVETRVTGRAMAEAGAALALYGTVAQLLPAAPLAWFAALAGVATVLALRSRLSAQIALAGVAALWAAMPVVKWGVGGLLALAGEPLLVHVLPEWRMLLLRIVPALGVASAIVAAHRERLRGGVIAATLGWIVALHIAFRLALPLENTEQFAQSGLALRLGWEALLLGGAALVLRLRGDRAWPGQIAMVLGAAAMAHWAWFTLVLHNPLWANQAVGPVPLANLLVPLYAIGLGALMLAGRRLPEPLRRLAPAFDGAAMALITLLALSLLRQVFAGTALTVTAVGASESLLQSVLGIVLSIGFLWWGARVGKRSWRIGSLVLMLAAVGKVFLVDAAGLEGLARIASFVVLGFSLIGIGWFYSRQLRAPSSGPGNPN